MSGYGTMPAGPRRRWPDKEPDDFTWWTYDATPDLTNPATREVDIIISAALNIKPSGAGEILASLLTVDATRRFVTTWLAFGVPGRPYTVNLVVGTQGGQIRQFPIGITCDPAYSVQWPSPPQSPGFGPLLTWAGQLAMADSAGNIARDSGGNLIFEGLVVALDSNGHPVRDNVGNFVFAS